MINKDTYRQVKVAILSGVAEYKDKENNEVWWKDSDYGEKITIELLDYNKIIVRVYWIDGTKYLERFFVDGKLKETIEYEELYKKGKLVFSHSFKWKTL